MMITSLSDPNQNLKMENKLDLSLEPDHQGTRQDCGRFLEQAQPSKRTSQDYPLEEIPRKQTPGKPGESVLF